MQSLQSSKFAPMIQMQGDGQTGLLHRGLNQIVQVRVTGIFAGGAGNLQG